MVGTGTARTVDGDSTDNSDRKCHNPLLLIDTGLKYLATMMKHEYMMIHKTICLATNVSWTTRELNV